MAELILQGFRIYVGPDERKVEFVAGEIVQEADVPEGQSIAKWREHGLSRAHDTASDAETSQT